MNEKLIVTGRTLPISEATKKRNPEMFGGVPVAEQLHTKKPKSNRGREGKDCGVEAGRAGVRYRITFTVYRRRLLDTGDNDRYALKRGRDLVAALLGFSSDNHPKLEWCYHQIRSNGPIGTQILVEMITE